ncbi:hypothetical protein F2P81_024940 [Scophthalmus maximus]|uniref:Uncharacterized protein n=1 Tax=Scophthalmus maximus TaxID=52904 RepID=A0A6A4RRP7_SCOMX|nr:hypothetical protein F2P81_024940 [Scophthalmus maximus]
MRRWRNSDVSAKFFWRPLAVRLFRLLQYRCQDLDIHFEYHYIDPYIDVIKLRYPTRTLTFWAATHLSLVRKGFKEPEHFPRRVQGNEACFSDTSHKTWMQQKTCEINKYKTVRNLKIPLFPEAAARGAVHLVIRSFGEARRSMRSLIREINAFVVQRVNVTHARRHLTRERDVNDGMMQEEKTCRNISSLHAGVDNY